MDNRKKKEHGHLTSNLHWERSRDLHDAVNLWCKKSEDWGQKKKFPAPEATARILLLRRGVSAVCRVHPRWGGPRCLQSRASGSCMNRMEPNLRAKSGFPSRGNVARRQKRQTQVEWLNCGALPVTRMVAGCSSNADAEKETKRRPRWWKTRWCQTCPRSKNGRSFKASWWCDVHAGYRGFFLCIFW